MTDGNGRWRIRWIALVVAAVLAMSGASAAMSFLMHSEDPGDCATCHGDSPVLPADHVPTAGMGLGDCIACHAPETPLSLQSAIPLDHHHLLGGVTCQACHGDTETPAPMSTAQCLACHGPLEELAARTTDVRPANPHSTPHGPTFAECDLCHQIHSESDNFCAQCHNFDYTVP